MFVRNMFMFLLINFPVVHLEVMNMEVSKFVTAPAGATFGPKVTACATQCLHSDTCEGFEITDTDTKQCKLLECPLSPNDIFTVSQTYGK